MHCQSVACGIASQAQSAMQSTTPSFAADMSRYHSRYHEAGNMIETHEHAGDFKEP